MWEWILRVWSSVKGILAQAVVVVVVLVLVPVDTMFALEMRNDGDLHEDNSVGDRKEGNDDVLCSLIYHAYFF